MIPTMKRIFPIILGLLLIAAPSLPGRADLLIMPIDITFQNRDRMANVTLFNTGDKPATYRMSWRYQVQNAQGGYDIPKDPPDTPYDVGKMIVFSPRQVTLPPGGKQGIRLSLRRPAGLPDGEYRAYLLMKSQNVKPVRTPPPDTAQANPQPNPADKPKVKIALEANVGYSLPVIVRQGTYDATATISDPKFSTVTERGKTTAVLNLTLTRSGHYSTIGQIKVFWAPPGGEEKKIGTVNHVNVFSEITGRPVRVRLKENQIGAGTIRIVYEGNGPDKGIIFDEKTFPVGE